MYHNKILQETCHCHLPLKNHQLIQVTVKAGRIDDGIFGKITYQGVAWYACEASLRKERYVRLNE